MDVLMPQLGETVAEGKITKWFKSAGDAVKPGDNLFEIETDKVSMEVPSTDAGTARRNPRQRGRGGAGRRRRRGDRGHGSGASSPRAKTAKPAPKSAPATPPASPPQTPLAQRMAAHGAARLARRAAEPPRTAPIALDPFFEVRTPERNYGPARLPGGTFVTPLARRLASEQGIDLGACRGSGAARPHRRARRRAGGTARAAPRRRTGARSERRSGQGALSRRAVRGGAARRHAPHHRDAAGAGEADHPALLPHRRCRDRRADGSCAKRPTRPRRRTRTALRPSSCRSTTSSSRRGRRRCSACRPPTRCGRRIASCASSSPTSASRSRSTAG